MYSIVQQIHSIIRWIYLAGLLGATLRAWYGWRGNRTWSKMDNQLTLSLMIVADVQMLTGVMLYLVLSPITKEIWNDFYGVFYKAAFQFFGIYHLLVMLSSIFLVQLMRKLNQTADSNITRFKQSLLILSIALLVTILAIPW